MSVLAAIEVWEAGCFQLVLLQEHHDQSLQLVLLLVEPWSWCALQEEASSHHLDHPQLLDRGQLG